MMITINGSKIVIQDREQTLHARELQQGYKTSKSAVSRSLLTRGWCIIRRPNPMVEKEDLEVLTGSRLSGFVEECPQKLPEDD